MINKLKRKFIIISMCIVVAVIGSIIASINVTNFLRVNKEANNILRVLSENDGQMPLPPFTDGENPAPGIAPEQIFQTRYFTVTVANGEIVAVDNSKIFLSEEEAKAYANTVIAKGKTSGYYKEYKITQITVQDGEMLIFLNCSRDLSFSKTFFKISTLIGLGAIVLIFILVCVFSPFAIKPMVESYQKQKRFITDANHEIKTPLAIINATNEVLEIQYGENEWTASIKNQIKKLSSLTEKLVFLSRMDEENAKIPMQEFDLSSTVLEVAETFESVAKIDNKQYKIEVEPNVKYIGEVSLIGQLISILLDNAFKYSSQNGSVEITLKNEKNNKLIVSNTVDDFDKNNLDKLFERFYRPDSSRNSQTGGHGIGLSIAKSIVNLHKGKITVETEGNTILFIVAL